MNNHIRLYLEAFHTITNNNTINRSIDVPQQLILIVRNCMQQNPRTYYT